MYTEYCIFNMWLILLSVFIVFCYKFDIHKICYNNYIHYSKKLKKLNNLVKTTYSNQFMIIFVMIKMILKMIYIVLWQYLNRSIAHVGDNRYVISYVISGKLYKFYVTVEKGPSNIIMVLDEDDNDITEDFKMFYGPMGNFHGNSHTACDFAKKSLTIITDDNEHVFHSGQIINF